VTILPDIAKNWLRSFWLKLAGTLIIIMAFIYSIILASYNIYDDAVHAISSSGEVENFFGAIGACIADISLQTIGCGAFMVVIALFAVGYRMIAQQGIAFSRVKILFFMLACILASFAFAVLPRPEWQWSIPLDMGGGLGVMIHTLFYQVDLFLQIPWWIIFMVTLALAVFLLGKSVGVPWLLSSLMIFVIIAKYCFAYARKVAGKPCWFIINAFTNIKLKLISKNNEVGVLDIKQVDKENDTLFDFEQRSNQDVNDDKSYLARKAEELFNNKKHEAVSSIPTTSSHHQPQQQLDLPKLPIIKPSLDLLQMAHNRVRSFDRTELEKSAAKLMQVLAEFGVKGEILNVLPGPVVTLYELQPAAGVKSSRVINLADDIARSMSALSARVAVIPGKNAIGIELPNRSRETVFLRSVFSHEKYQNSKAKLPMVLGKDIGGEPQIVDLAKMPHVLVAGTTGSGKSVSINTMILSLLYKLSPDQCRLIMVDPKMLELSVYEGIPHLLSPVVTDPKKAVVALKWVVREMEQRYYAMSQLGVRNIEGYNQRLSSAQNNGEVLTKKIQTGYDAETGKAVFEEQEIALKTIPYIVVIVDEMADLMMVAGKDIEAAIQRLAQMARAAGIHIIMATQRPSVDVITGTIKANFPTRISFMVSSKIDSRTILGEPGAEQLLGQGDMLYMATGGKVHRVHGPFVSDDEVEGVVNFLKEQAPPDYVEGVFDDSINTGDGSMGDFSESASPSSATGASDRDSLYEQAVQVVIRDKKSSISYIQRALQIGYNRSARIIEQMEQDGILSSPNNSGKREILLGKES
jgi:S-DNA-T family DNA segregation ATPase FtsK/SpoIIIE